MGVYDILYPENFSVQVKCWDCEMKSYKAGDKVPELDGKQSYHIICPEGMGARVLKVTLQEPLGFDETRDASIPAYDKWGDPWTGKNTNLMGGPYFWDEPAGKGVNM